MPNIALLVIALTITFLAPGPATATVRWGDFTLGVASEQDVRSMLTAKNATIIGEG